MVGLALSQVWKLFSADERIRTVRSGRQRKRKRQNQQKMTQCNKLDPYSNWRDATCSFQTVYLSDFTSTNDRFVKQSGDVN